jgi:nitrite reductase (NADH) large subunit
VTGVDLYSAGDIVGGGGSEDLVLRDRRGGVYKRLVVGNRRLLGVVLYGDVGDGPWYFELIQNRTDISAIRNHLLFGQAQSLAAA